jgi:hypothetical protein
VVHCDPTQAAFLWALVAEVARVVMAMKVVTESEAAIPIAVEIESAGFVVVAAAAQLAKPGFDSIEYYPNTRGLWTGLARDPEYH